MATMGTTTPAITRRGGKNAAVAPASSSDSSSISSTRGYPALLNLREQPHWTVVVSDFPLPRRDAHSIAEQLNDTCTRPLFLTIHNVGQVLDELRRSGVNLDRDYVSLQGFVFRHTNVLKLHTLLASIPRSDLARIELPLPECGFRPAFASRLLQTVLMSDYDEQERVADRFFDLLDRAKPYTIGVETDRATLKVIDNRSWFDLSGRLRQQELRILPAGEVSYTGDHIRGKFTVDGAIVPFPEHPDVANDAKMLQRVSRGLRNEPLRFTVRDGRVVDLGGNKIAADVFSKLFDRDDRYRNVTEVGIAFNRQCADFIHDWPAASNESRPGVHIGIGGDPSPDQGSARGKPLVHIDCVAANCRVFVNEHPFLRASS